MYIDKFILPIDKEIDIIRRKMYENGGAYGYIDNPYPCGIFEPKRLKEISFGKATIFYGGNGSGKSTLLNLIAEKLELNRMAPLIPVKLFHYTLMNVIFLWDLMKTGLDTTYQTAAE